MKDVKTYTKARLMELTQIHAGVSVMAQIRHGTPCGATHQAKLTQPHQFNTVRLTDAH